MLLGRTQDLTVLGLAAIAAALVPGWRLAGPCLPAPHYCLASAVASTMSSPPGGALHRISRPDSSCI